MGQSWIVEVIARFNLHFISSCKTQYFKLCSVKAITRFGDATVDHLTVVYVLR